MNSFSRGKAFEQKVAKMTRMALDKAAKRNPGSHANWNRRSDIYTELPFHIEAKDHETMKPKEWFRQADEASMNKTPVVAFQMEGEVMAMIRYSDFLNLLVEIADQKLEIADLRQPIRLGVDVGEAGGDKTAAVAMRGNKIEAITFKDGTLKREVKLCKNGHICSPGRDTCMTKGCVYSSTYIKPKAKKENKK